MKQLFHHKEVPILTIKDLAAQTGYSVGTISRVLNNQPNVSQKARDVILQAAADSGFQLNANAKQLKQQHGNSILVMVKGTNNELFGSLVEAIQARISQTSYPLVVDYMDEPENEVRRAVQLSLEKKPLGIFFLGGNRDNFLADFDKIRVPCVLITNDASDLPFSNLSSVSSDNKEAARMAIEHLVDLGHRKIAVIGGSRTFSDPTEQRFQGCMAAFREHGIPFDEALDYATVRFSFAGGYNGAKALLERNRDFTAIFAMSDVMAIGAIRALQDAGKRVPDDISIVGFDGIAIGSYTVPSLTTICQPTEALAMQSVDLLLGSIGGTPKHRCETVAVSLAQKESARKID